jgi:hypothetical protein
MTATPCPPAGLGTATSPAPPPGSSMTARLWRWARRGGVTVAGLGLLAGGAVMLVLPGPGLVTIAAGLALLATEYDWAARLLMAARQRVVWLGQQLRARLHGSAKSSFSS